MRMAVFALVTCLVLLGAGVAGAQNPNAQNFTGTLVDAACKAATPSNACEVSDNTSSFGIMTSDGKVLSFDSAGNEKAAAELKKSQKRGQVSADVTGTLEGANSIRVESITLR